MVGVVCPEFFDDSAVVVVLCLFIFAKSSLRHCSFCSQVSSEISTPPDRLLMPSLGEGGREREIQYLAK